MQFANHVLHSCYLGTEHSSGATKSRATRLAGEIGGYHLNATIDLMVTAVVKVFSLITGKTPRFQADGGGLNEDLALQNIQARLRMVMSYLLAQLLPWCRGKKGFLLVLGTGNVDEALRGYFTKYDCSSADINPIGAVSKGDLKQFLLWAANRCANSGWQPCCCAMFSYLTWIGCADLSTPRWLRWRTQYPPRNCARYCLQTSPAPAQVPAPVRAQAPLLVPGQLARHAVQRHRAINCTLCLQRGGLTPTLTLPTTKRLLITAKLTKRRWACRTTSLGGLGTSVRLPAVAPWQCSIASFTNGTIWSPPKLLKR